MSILPECYSNLFFNRSMISDDLETRDFYDFSTDSFLIRDLEVSNRLIFTPDLTLTGFEFFGFFHHLLRDRSEFSSLVSKHVGLIFVGLDFFFETAILAVLSFDPAFYLFNGIMIIPDELFDLASEDIEIEDSISK